MANSFNIKLDDKPFLSNMKDTDVQAFKEVVGTFVNLMEVSAQKGWHRLPQAINTSLSFADIIGGVLNAVMTTKEIEPDAFATLELDLHPLALLSDKRKNLITGSPEQYNWKQHFALDSDEISKEQIEKIIRKILYLVRWFDVETVSKSLMANQFPVMDTKDIAKLPFQPALMFQKNTMGDLFVGKFLHDIGAFNCGEIDPEIEDCPSCQVGKLEEVKNHKVCPRCNAGFNIKEVMNF